MPEQEVVATPEVETPQPEAPTETPVVEGTPEVAETPETPAPELYKITVDGQEEEHTLEELQELAAKGISYGKNKQALTEWETGRRQQLELAEKLSQEALEFQMARDLGYDPMLVLANLQPPPDYLREQSPELYNQQAQLYQFASFQRQQFESQLNAITQANAQSANQALFAKARVTEDLNDQELADVRAYVAEYMRPNQMGMYSEKQIQGAITAVVGAGRAERAKLKASSDIQKTITKAVKTPPKTVNAKPPVLTPKEQEEREFTEYLRMKANPPKG